MPCAQGRFRLTALVVVLLSLVTVGIARADWWDSFIIDQTLPPTVREMPAGELARCGGVSLLDDSAAKGGKAGVGAKAGAGVKPAALP